MFKIKTPSDIYNGITVGIKFENGIGFTEDEKVKNTLVNDFGYELVNEEVVNNEGTVKHVGGGYFELPNGEKVKGKELALEKLNELNKEDQEKGE